MVEEDQEEMQLTAEQGRRVKELSTDVTVQNLALVEIVADRTVQQVLHALARMHARLRSLGLPIHRLHGDKAKELVSHQTHRWAADRQIVVTHTTGDSFKSNGRVEQEVGMLKRMVRILLKNQDWGENSLRLWPALARHSGERRLRSQLRRLGCPVPLLLPVG